MTKKKVYSDEEIKAHIYRLGTKQALDFLNTPRLAAMLTQLLDERDGLRQAYNNLVVDFAHEKDLRQKGLPASDRMLDTGLIIQKLQDAQVLVLTERDAILKDLKALEEDVMHGVDFTVIDLSRSEKYEKGVTG